MTNTDASATRCTSICRQDLVETFLREQVRVRLFLFDRPTWRRAAGLHHFPYAEAYQEREMNEAISAAEYLGVVFEPDEWPQGMEMVQ